MRYFNLLDHIIIGADSTLKTLLPAQMRPRERINPATNIEDCILSTKERKHIAGLMRVNHAGEISAQALYQGQAATANLSSVKAQMEQAAAEEIDHLAWCEDRLKELKSNPSILNPVWYYGSFLIGALAGLLGDKWSLGFVAETENQVTKHLQNHLIKLPSKDKKTLAIVNQMIQDETQHANAAIKAGANELPLIVKLLMGFTSKLLTTSSYYI